jgi:hypothetical protein
LGGFPPSSHLFDTKVFEMRNVIAALAFLALVTSCGGGAVAVPTATSTTAVETTSSTAFKLPPVGDTPEEVEAEFVRIPA